MLEPLICLHESVVDIVPIIMFREYPGSIQPTGHIDRGA